MCIESPAYPIGNITHKFLHFELMYRAHGLINLVNKMFDHSIILTPAILSDVTFCFSKFKQALISNIYALSIEGWEGTNSLRVTLSSSRHMGK